MKKNILYMNKFKIQSFFVILVLLLSLCAENHAFAANAGYGLQFNGGNQYVNLGNLAGLSAYTIELWFKQTGTGVGVNTGTGGLIGAIPLLTKGYSQGDGSGIDINYFLGISSGGYIAADFEEGATANQGLNHPLIGTTALQNGVWYHAAATYDGAVFSLYLNGNLEASVAVNRVPATDGTQNVALGSALNTTGVASGFFAGQVDEARIWNRSLSQTEIQNNRYSELTSGAGLVSRWGINEGSGTITTDSVAGSSGALINTPSWVAGFLIPDSTPPAAPNLTALSFTNAAQLNWSANSEADLVGYNIYRSTAPIISLSNPLNGAVPLTTTNYLDLGLSNGTTYYYVITALDSSGNQSIPSNQVSVTPLASQGSALKLDGSSSYVTFGDPAKLDLEQFTIETWFKRTGAGISASTGNGGITNAIPLVTHGASENDASNVDANWVLAINNSTGTLAADFEDDVDGTNHPIFGTTPITYNVWHHAAATYDGLTWNLYLDGKLEATLVANASPRSDSIQQVALGTMIQSNGAALGRFDGVLDEVRVWDVARTFTQIKSTINSELTSGTGLVARWGLNEGSGTVVGDSIATSANGTIIGSGASWVPGAPFNIFINQSPNQPVLVAPANGGTNVSTSPNLTVNVTDPESDTLTVSFYGRKKTGASSTPFTMIVLPDTQYYSAYSPDMFMAQTQWIVDNQAARNIVYVVHLGDLVQNGAQYPQEWLNARGAMDLLDPADIPYGVGIGNHDYDNAGDGNSTTLSFNQYFGVSHFSGRSYYGGYYDDNNDNHYDLFRASGLDFVVIYMAYKENGPSTEVLDWADAVLKSYPNRIGMIMTHNLFEYVTYDFSTAGNNIYNALKDNPNLYLMLGGHVTAEIRRADTYDGHTIYSLLSDYQEGGNYGDGWLRILEFQPANDQISVSTFSPTRNNGAGDYQSDSNSQFTIPLAMGGAYSLIGTTTVASGSNATVSWSDLEQHSDYEWYAVASDGEGSAQSATFNFSTSGTNHSPVAKDQAISTDEDTSINITLAGTDEDNNLLSYTVLSNPANGILSGSAPNLTYLPNSNWNGIDTFTFKVNDGSVDSNIATVTISVQPVNDPPAFTSSPVVTATESSLYTYNITAADVDGGNVLIITNPIGLHWLNLVDHGDGTAILSGTPGNFDVGLNPVTLRVSDGNVTVDQSFIINVGYGVTPPSVTINQAIGQADPTNTAPINFTAIFSEDVDNFNDAKVTLSGTAGATTAVVTRITADKYDVAVSGMTGPGTVSVTIAAGVVNDLGGNPNLASTSTDNLVYYDNTLPTVTVNQASGQADPTNASTLDFSIVFSEAVTGFDEADVILDGTAGASTKVITGSGPTYTVTVSGMVNDGTVTLSLPAGAVQDAAGNPNAPSTSTDNTVTYDATAPTVTINQSIGQNDPTSSAPISFDVLFSEPVLGFSVSSLTLGGTAGPATAVISGAGPAYTAAVSGMTGNGTVIVSIAAGKVTDAAGNPNIASSGIDNTVTYDTSIPVVQINPPSALLTAGAPVSFPVMISGATVVNLTAADVTLNKTGTANGIVNITNGTAANPTLTVSGIIGDGTLGITIAAGVAQNAAANSSLASAPSATFAVDNTAPLVMIGAPSVSLTNTGPVSFPVTISGASSINLTNGDVTLVATGTANGTVSVTGGTTSTPMVTVSGITGDGTLAISIAAGVTGDAAGNTSASAGPSATFAVDNVAPVLMIDAPSVSLTNTGPVSFPVTVGGASSINLTNSDVTLVATGTANGTVNVTGGTTANPTVTVSGITGDGTLAVSIAAGIAADAAGNTSALTGPSVTFVVDNTAPLVTIGAPSVSLTNTGPVSFPVTISGASSINLTVADVALSKTGTANGTVSVTGGTTANPTVTVSGITGDGTLAISIAAGISADAAGNTNASAGPSATFAVDNTAPLVTIGAPSVSLTNTGPVSFQVTIGGASSINLTNGDVTLVATGTANGTVNVTNGTTSTPTVTVSGITGNGTLAISIAVGIAGDAAGNTSASAGSSATFDVDNTAPLVIAGAPSVSLTNTGPVSFPVTISGATVVNLTAADVTLNKTGTANGIVNITNGATANPTVTVSGITGDGTLGITIAAGVAQNAAANSSLASAPSATFAVDNTAPLVTIGASSVSLTNTGPVSFPVTIIGASSINLTNGDVTLVATGTANGTVSVTGGTTSTPTVTVSGITGDGTLAISIAAGVAGDVAGNTSASAGPSATFDVDNTAPLVLSIVRNDPNPNNTGNVSYGVTFDSPISGLNAANFSLTTSLGCSASISSVNGSGTSYTVIVDTCSNDGSLGLNLSSGTGVVDAAGNLVGNLPFSGEVYTIVKANPVVLSITRADPNPTTASSAAFTVQFSKAVVNLDVSNFGVVATGVSGASITGLSGTGSVYTVVVNLGSGEGTVGLNMVNSTGVTDGVGNAVSGLPFVGEYYTIDLTAPQVTADGINSVPDTGDARLTELEIVTVGVNQLLVSFDEDLNNPAGDSDGKDVTNPANYILVRDNGDGLQTISCKVGVTGGDMAVTIDSVTYSNGNGKGPFVSTLNLNGGNQLPNGVYRLLVCGSTSIVDLVGNELAGDGVTSQTDFLRNFVMAATNNGSGTGTSNTQKKDFSGLSIPVTGFAPDLFSMLPFQPAEKAYTTYSGLVLEIPHLGVRMDIVGVPETKEGWDVTWLGKQAGYLSGSAFPTMSGNSVITAHVWDAFNKPGPFYNLKTLSYGDKIIIRAWGQVFTYEVRSQQQVTPGNIYAAMKRETLSWVTLITCEDFNAKTGSYAYRRLVRAVLVSVEAEK